MANEDSPRGFALALTVYLLWGFLPLYMKAMAHIPATEVLAHRIIWSVPIAAAVLLITRRTQDLRAALRNPRLILMALLPAALISVNWGIYVWSIASGNALEAALGYYINPLFSVALGALLLGERMTRAQLAAVALAAVAVLILTVAQGTVPYVALGLTVTWGFYAYLKKSLPIGPNQGFTLEVLILLPFALAYAAWLGWQGTNHFSGTDMWLLLGCGVVTAVPLMIYANAAKGLRLTTIAVMQYIAPTMIFLTAVFWFGEPFGTARAIAFPLIWTALVIFTVSLLRQRRQDVE